MDSIHSPSSPHKDENYKSEIRSSKTHSHPLRRHTRQRKAKNIFQRLVNHSCGTGHPLILIPDLNHPSTVNKRGAGQGKAEKRRSTRWWANLAAHQTTLPTTSLINHRWMMNVSLECRNMARKTPGTVRTDTVDSSGPISTIRLQSTSKLDYNITGIYKRACMSL